MNYILKVRNDTHFLSYSILNKYIPLSPKYDPFIVYPSKNVEQLQYKFNLT